MTAEVVPIPTSTQYDKIWNQHAHHLWEGGVSSSDEHINDEVDLPADCLGRELYAWRYTEVLKGAKSQKLVLEVNGGYGTGKTYFLRQWANSINEIYKGEKGSKESSLGVAIYYSAWDVDFHQGALLPLLHELGSKLQQYGNQPSLKEKVKSILPAIKDILGRGANIAMASNGIAFDANAASDKVIEVVGKTFDEYEIQKGKIQSFKTLLSEISQELGGITIFVDELERCRPTHAVETLEIIKHLLNVKGVHVVIGTDREQLKHTIKNLYGQDMDGDEYLRRFIDIEMTLPDPNYYSFAKYLANTVDDKYWLAGKCKTELDNLYYGKSIFVDTFSNICNHHKVKLNQFSLHPPKVSSLRRMVKAMEIAKYALVSNIHELPYYPRLLAVVSYMQTFDEKRKSILKSYVQDTGASSELLEIFNKAISFSDERILYDWIFFRSYLINEDKIIRGISDVTELNPGYNSPEAVHMRRLFTGFYGQWKRESGVEKLNSFCSLKGTKTVLQAMIKTIQNGETLAENSSGKS